MQTVRIVQAVVLVQIVVVVASCAASKEYTSKLFTPRNAETAVAKTPAPLRFLDVDSAMTDTKDWVTTDIIMGRDTNSNTLALDKLSTIYPANTASIKRVESKPDSTVKIDAAKVDPATIAAKPTTAESEPVAKNITTGEVRNKKTREETK